MSNTITGAKGITFSGETFIVPQTHDMVKTLFDPTIKKSLFEMLIVGILTINMGAVFLIPDNSIRIKCFIGLYVFWRLSYDFGIGYVLRQQSLHNKWVKWCRDNKIFEKNNKSFFSRLLKYEIGSQMGKTYDIDEYPIEFNTWLIFRRFVDLILMSDFVNFVGLFMVCFIDNDYESINLDQQNNWLVYLRVVTGITLIIFNYWVKVNAHNTIKDYAWYWGDFFFRQINNEDLIFDGVFEMVPHPMYSVGYIGYYGFALIAKSYTVLIFACFGHFLQMIFLHFIENPHIDKIYGPSANEIDSLKLIKLKDLKNFNNAKPLIGVWNFNILRGSDLMNLVLIFTYSIFVPFLLYISNFNNTENKLVNFLLKSYQINVKINSLTVLFYLTVSIKLFESFSINTLLFLQSNFKSFTKYYLSNDIPVEKSLNNFAIIYNSLISLTYSSFFGLNVLYVLTGEGKPELLFNDWFYLRMFIGILLIVTHTWINCSIIDSIGYFGWFYGDFFIPKSSLPHKAHLTKAGVYRYLNNPEQIFGVCGIMGVCFMIPTNYNLVLCGLWVANNFIRINGIEKLHMIKLYGENEVLKDSGVTKTFKKHLIPDVIQRRLSNNHDDSRNDLLKQHRRKSSIVATATDTIDQLIKELKKSNTKLTQQNIYELSQNLYFENSDYKLNIKNLSYDDSDDKLLKFITIGEPIQVEFNCPETHSPKDWIGLYKVVQTSYSRYKTLISSNNRWLWVKDDSSGVLTFQKEKLFWEEGIYEFRYHIDGKHDVAYVSEPFEIKIPKINVSNDTEDILEFSKILKGQIFDKFLPFDSVNDVINEKFETSDNFLDSYKRLSKIISSATNIQISEKIFLYNDDLTILKLGSKLVHMKKVLDELSNDGL